MSKKATKIFKKLDPLQGGDVILDKLGLPSLTGSDYGLLTGQGQDAMTGSTAAAPDTTPTSVDPAVIEARNAQRRRQLQAAGLSSTIATGAGGLSGSANTAVKTLLGS